MNDTRKTKAQLVEELGGMRQRAALQNRELTIQNALERVRSLALGMHKSAQVDEVSRALLTELKGLDLEIRNLTIAIIDTAADRIRISIQREGIGLLAGSETPLHEFVQIVQFDLQAWHEGRAQSWFRDEKSETFSAWLDWWIDRGGRNNPGYVYDGRNDLRRHECAIPFINGALILHGPNPVPEQEIAVVKRFADLFGFAWDRFLELQRLESQNRELQVEAALERVWSGAHGMRSSDDIGGVTTQLFREFIDLGIPLRRSGILILDVEPGMGEIWLTDSKGALRKGEPFDTSELHGHKTMASVYQAFRQGDPHVHTELSIAETVDLVFFWRDHLHTALEFAGVDPPVMTRRVSAIYPDDRVHNHFMMFPQGIVFLSRTEELCEEEVEVAQRFASVFGFAFSRMQEITRAERAARQAERRAAVDQVRAEIAVMHTSADLERVVTPLIWRKLTEVGVPFLRVGVFIFDEDSRQVHAFLANHAGKPLEDITLPFDNQAPALSFIADMIEHWRTGRLYTQHWDRQTFTETMQAMIAQDPTLDPERYLDAKEPPESLNLQMAPFAQGMLYVGSEAPLSTEDIRLTQELAAAFSVAYARFQDFQRLEEKNLALEVANAQVEEASLNKSQFLRRMSHDLRSPMNAIIGYSRLLRRRTADRLDEREQRNLRNIETSSGNLLNLINDILDLSRIEAGRIEVNLRPVDVGALSNECADVLESIVQQSVVLRRDLADIGLINSDVDRLRQVIMNLLGNATKFTNAGSITLSLRRDGDTAVELSIADTGIGIPAEDLPHIFDEFRQVERQGGEQSEGTGLGLAIAKKTVELLGGSISATSEVGVGTTFTVRLNAS